MSTLHRRYGRVLAVCRMTLLVCAIVGASVEKAWAHAGGGPLHPEVVWHHWNWDPWIWVPLFLSHWLYGRGLASMRRASAIVPPWRIACFVLGEIVLVCALMSPIDPLGETLLSAHMVQHILLTVAAPPLLVLGRPHIVWLWAVPARQRRLAGHKLARLFRVSIDRLSHPVTAGMVAGGVMWLWHAPFLFEAALDYGWVHKLEHITFFLSALLLWRAIIDPARSPALRVAVVLLTFMHSGMLGGLLSFAPVQLYSWYGGYAHLWGLTPVEDQQIAGLLMWTVGGAPYLIAFAVLSLSIFEDDEGAPDGSSLGKSTGAIRASTSSPSMK